MGDAQGATKAGLLLDLLLTFAKIGLFTFGGGYAMIALMDNECVERKKWISHDEFMDVTVIAESTPGPIAINGATYIGYRQAGFPGAVLATVGMVLPSFVILYLISLFFDNILEVTPVANAFKGIKIAVGILILHAALKMFKKMHRGILPLTILSGSLVASLLIHAFRWNVSSICFILLSGMAGYLTLLFGQGERGKGASTHDLS